MPAPPGVCHRQGVHFEPNDALWSECRRLALEVADIAPALTSVDGAVAVRVLTPAAGIEAGAYYEAVRRVSGCGASGCTLAVFVGSGP